MTRFKKLINVVWSIKRPARSPTMFPSGAVSMPVTHWHQHTMMHCYSYFRSGLYQWKLKLKPSRLLSEKVTFKHHNNFIILYIVQYRHLSIFKEIRRHQNGHSSATSSAHHHVQHSFHSCLYDNTRSAILHAIWAKGPR